MALGDAKSGRDVGLTLRSDSRLAFRRPGRHTQGAHRTQGIIFADESMAGIALFAKWRPLWRAMSDFDSKSRRSVPLIWFVSLVFFVLIPSLVVLDNIASCVAAADSHDRWVLEFGSSSLHSHFSFEVVPLLSHVSNRRSPVAGLLFSILMLRWLQKSRSICSLGGFNDHYMWTCLLFLIRSIWGSHSRSCGSSRTEHVRCRTGPMNSRYLHPRDKIPCIPMTRFAKVPSLSFIV